jgi:hypothetical protein
MLGLHPFSWGQPGKRATFTGMHAIFNVAVDGLAAHLMLGSVLKLLREQYEGFELIDHWQQGEFHHDTVLKVHARGGLPGEFLVVATNCNGGVKEVLCFQELPTRGALWKARCPQSDEFSGQLPPLLARATTQHFFDPCDLLKADARSEYRQEFRERQPGGGWRAKKPSCAG